MYDKDFRIHMSKHPERNWGIILQQAWSLRLKDRVSSGYHHGNHNHSHNSSEGNSKNDSRDKEGEPCW